MYNLRVAITITLGVTFALSLILNTMGILITGKRFIYNLSQMEYSEAYRVVEKLASGYLSELPPEYAGIINEEMIRTELARYLADASELTAIENTIYSLSQQAKTYISGLILKLSTVALIIILIWYELRQAKRQETVKEV